MPHAGLAARGDRRPLRNAGRYVFELNEEPKSIAWSADGAMLAMTTESGVALMSPDGDAQAMAAIPEASTIRAHPTRPVFAVAAGKRIALASHEGWSWISEGHSVAVETLSFSIDGDALYVGAGKNDAPGSLTELALEWD